MAGISTGYTCGLTSTGTDVRLLTRAHCGYWSCEVLIVRAMLICDGLKIVTPGRDSTIIDRVRIERG
jgi:hypothetical protein